MLEFVDKYGREIDLTTWGKLHSDTSYIMINQTTLFDGKWISTIWIGINHSFVVGKEMFFETIVFENENNLNAIHIERYTTLKEAKTGHKKVVEHWMEKVSNG